ncbi:MAG: transglycosylase SLT domain-containing protein [Nanoarchaeota archaeon]
MDNDYYGNRMYQGSAITYPSIPGLVLKRLNSGANDMKDALKKGAKVSALGVSICSLVILSGDVGRHHENPAILYVAPEQANQPIPAPSIQESLDNRLGSFEGSEVVQMGSRLIIDNSISIPKISNQADKEFQPVQKEPASKVLNLENSRRIHKFVIHYTSTNQKIGLENGLERIYYWADSIRQVCKEKDYSFERLVAQIFVESGGWTNAVSRSDAVGPLQFKEDTATSYGLWIDKFIDQRRDYKKSARAAIDFIKKYEKLLGSSEMALACYNRGYGTLMKAAGFDYKDDKEFLSQSKKFLSQKTDFWQIPLDKLGKEGKEYVEKVLAIEKILKNGNRYNIKMEFENRPSCVLYKIEKGDTSFSIANEFRISVFDIKRNNPQYHSLGHLPIGGFLEIPLTPSNQDYISANFQVYQKQK